MQCDPYSDLHVNLDGFTLLKSEIQLLLRLLLLLLDLLSILQPFEMILEGNVQVKTVRPIQEANTDEGRSSVVVLNSQDEVSGGVGDRLYRYTRILLDGALGEQLARNLVLQLYRYAVPLRH